MKESEIRSIRTGTFLSLVLVYLTQPSQRSVMSANKCGKDVFPSCTCGMMVSSMGNPHDLLQHQFGHRLVSAAFAEWLKWAIPFYAFSGISLRDDGVGKAFSLLSLFSLQPNIFSACGFQDLPAPVSTSMLMMASGAEFMIILLFR